MDQQQREQTCTLLLQLLSLLLNSVIPTILQYIQQYYNKQPYHTSILRGHDWVQELLLGHPQRIRTELGMHKHVFLALIDQLHTMGHTHSKFITLEEQLVIVKGLPSMYNAFDLVFLLQSELLQMCQYFFIFRWPYNMPTQVHFKGLKFLTETMSNCGITGQGFEIPFRVRKFRTLRGFLYPWPGK
jgi:hypothetical protein